MTNHICATCGRPFRIARGRTACPRCGEPIEQDQRLETLQQELQRTEQAAAEAQTRRNVFARAKAMALNTKATTLKLQINDLQRDRSD